MQEGCQRDPFSSVVHAVGSDTLGRAHSVRWPVGTQGDLGLVCTGAFFRGEVTGADGQVQAGVFRVVCFSGQMAPGRKAGGQAAVACAGAPDVVLLWIYTHKDQQYIAHRSLTFNGRAITANLSVPVGRPDEPQYLHTLQTGEGLCLWHDSQQVFISTDLVACPMDNVKFLEEVRDCQAALHDAHSTPYLGCTHSSTRTCM